MIRWLVIGLTVLAMSGCTTVRLAYNTSDKLIAYQLNNWFDLSGDLDAPAHDRLAKVMAWHRHEELPEYSKVLLVMRDRLNDPAPVTTAQVLVLQGQVAQRVLDVGNHVADAFADLFPRFGPAQRKRLLERMEESNNEFREKNIDITQAKLRKRRIDGMVDRYEFWLGKLDSAQRERVAQWADDADVAGKERLAYRQARQRVFLEIFDAGKTAAPAETASRLHAFFADMESPKNPAEKAHQRVQLERWATLTADLINSATPAQRKRAQEKLQTMSDDFLTLSRKSAG